MKKILCTLFLCVALLPLAIQLLIGPGAVAGAFQQWSVATLNAAEPAPRTAPQAGDSEAAANVENAVAAGDGHDSPGFSTALCILAGSISILAMMHRYKPSPAAMHLATQVNVILLFECLLEFVHASLALDALGSIVFNTLTLTGLLPLHHYIAAKCADLMALQPLLSWLKAAPDWLIKAWMQLWKG